MTADLFLDGSVGGHVDVGHDGVMMGNSANGVSSRMHGMGLIAGQDRGVRRCEDRIIWESVNVNVNVNVEVEEEDVEEDGKGVGFRMRDEVKSCHWVPILASLPRFCCAGDARARTTSAISHPSRRNGPDTSLLCLHVLAMRAFQGKSASRNDLTKYFPWLRLRHFRL